MLLVTYKISKLCEKLKNEDGINRRMIYTSILSTLLFFVIYFYMILDSVRIYCKKVNFCKIMSQNIPKHSVLMYIISQINYLHFVFAIYPLIIYFHMSWLECNDESYTMDSHIYIRLLFVVLVLTCIS